MNIGFYGATGSNDFGDYAMMVHNIQQILQYSTNEKNIRIYVFTPNKYNTLNNLLHNLINQKDLDRIEIIDEPSFRVNNYQFYLEKLFNGVFDKRPITNKLFSKLEKNYSNNLISYEFESIIKKLDVLIFNGGGYLQYSWKEKNINFCLACIAAKRNKVPVYFLGNSFGPMFKYDKYLKTALPYIDKVLVRDGTNYTAKYLTNNGFTDYVVGTDDLLFIGDTYNCPKLWDNYVIIEVMFFINKAQKGASHIISELIKLINTITKDKNVLLINFDVDDTLAQNYIEKILNSVEDRNKVRTYTKINNMYEVFGYYKNADFSISFKYHPIILSLGNEVPCIGIICGNDGYYEGKMKGAFDSCGLDWKKSIINIDEFSYSKMIKLYEDNLSNPQSIAKNKESLKKIYTNYMSDILI